MNMQTSPATQAPLCGLRVTGSIPRQGCRGVLTSLAVVAGLLVSAPALAQVLGTAANFAVLGATPNVTNTGNTIVTGNVGVYPAASIVGFPPGSIVPGTGFLHMADAVAQQAQTDNTAAFGVLTGLACAPIPAQLDDAARGGLPLVPGVYCPIAGDFDLTGTLTLAGPGLYVFQTAAALTTSPAVATVALGGASPCDVWWTVPSSASIGTGSVMAGNILALTSITLGTGASLQGRALAQTGTVTLDTNAVTACSGGTAPFAVAAPVAIAPPNTSVPTLSEWAMILLASLLAFVGFAAMRRQTA